MTWYHLISSLTRTDGPIKGLFSCYILKKLILLILKTYKMKSIKFYYNWTTGASLLKSVIIKIKAEILIF